MREPDGPSHVRLQYLHRTQQPRCLLVCLTASRIKLDPSPVLSTLDQSFREDTFLYLCWGWFVLPISLVAVTTAILVAAIIVKLHRDVWSSIFVIALSNSPREQLLQPTERSLPASQIPSQARCPQASRRFQDQSHPQAQKVEPDYRCLNPIFHEAIDLHWLLA